MSDNQSENSFGRGYAEARYGSSTPEKIKGRFGKDGFFYVNELDHVPTDAHYAVLYNATISVPGYDRGDPTETAIILKYIAFDGEASLQNWILEQDKSISRKTYTVLRVDPVKITKTISITVG